MNFLVVDFIEFPKMADCLFVKSELISLTEINILMFGNSSYTYVWKIIYKFSSRAGTKKNISISKYLIKLIYKMNWHKT
jgi:hypothetical protein